MLPQSPGVDPATCIPELEKCVKEYGNVGINLNPDPSGGHWTSPPLSDKAWYPDLRKNGGVRHPRHDSRFHQLQCLLSHHGRALFECRHHRLHAMFNQRFVQRIPYSAVLDSARRRRVPYHWGRFRGLAQELKKPLLQDHLLNNIYFDTCVYHQPGIDLLNTVIPVKNVLFASEMIGAVRGIDPETGNYYDDTKRYIEASKILSDADRYQIYEANTRRVFPRLDAALKKKGQ